MSPKKEFELEVKSQPMWLLQLWQTAILQLYPENHENSFDDSGETTQPKASLKHPISNTMPWGFGKVCLWESFLLILKF